ncbi:MAG: hypothetical protein H0U74_06805 [Bradymonadaceae bacterium]|nr:hypothetical protein [Lujinxingiaceae bacterium]
MSYTFTCWSCKKDTEKEDKIFRTDHCPHCYAAMKSCMNCSYYDAYAHNECKEPMAEYTKDKERANFCDYFKCGTNAAEGPNAAEIAKAKLDALFKK